MQKVEINVNFNMPKDIDNKLILGVCVILYKYRKFIRNTPREINLNCLCKQQSNIISSS